MSLECDIELEVKHSVMLAELIASTKSAHKRLDNMDDFVKEIRVMNNNMANMNTNVSLIAQEVKRLAQTSIKHEEDIDDIKKNMESKETVTRLHERFDSLEEDQDNAIKKINDRITNEENKEAKEALKHINNMKKWVVSSAVLLGTSLILIGIGVIYYAAKNGLTP